MAFGLRRATGQCFRLVAGVLVAMASLGAAGTPPERLTLAAPAYWCPFSCKSGSPQEGFAVDIVRAALRDFDIEVTYLNLPYDRALVEVREGDINAAVPVIQAEAPDFVFPDAAVSATEFCFYTNQANRWRFDGLESLQQIQFAATSAYSYGPEMDAYIRNAGEEGVFLMTGENIPDRLIRLVATGRFEAFLDDSRLIDYLQAERYQTANFRKAGCLDTVYLGYLGLSPSRSDSSELAQMFDVGLERIRESGEFQLILDSYGVEDWRAPKQ